MWNLKYDPTELLYKTETLSQIKKSDLCLPSGRRIGDEKDWEFGVSRCKLLFTGWPDNKIQPYSIGNYTQYSVKT